LLTAWLGVASQGVRPARVEPFVIEDATARELGLGGDAGEATTSQAADAAALCLSRVARTTTLCLPTERPAYFWGLTQLKKFPPSRLHSTSRALLVVNEIAAVVLEVDAGGWLVILTVGAPLPADAGLAWAAARETTSSRSKADAVFPTRRRLTVPGRGSMPRYLGAAAGGGLTRSRDRTPPFG
jgi:hypothetical protein